MEHPFKVPQLLLRIALGISFLTSVGGRPGFLGPSETGILSGANWERFIDYTRTMIPFLERPAVNIMGGIAFSAT